MVREVREGLVVVENRANAASQWGLYGQFESKVRELGERAELVRVHGLALQLPNRACRLA